MGKASKRVKRATQSDSEAEFDSEDALKGQAVKNQKVLWNKSLEIRFLLQKAFSNSNKLPKDPIRSEFCNSDKAVKFLFSKGLI